MLYFAYGSNLSTARLRQRVPSGELVATAVLSGHRLVFHKIGRDGSAKCNAWPTGRLEDFVLGAVYRIAPREKQLLDAAEGLGRGYDIRKTEVKPPGGGNIQVFLYAATAIDPGRRPFSWYKEHVLRGMQEHSFPEDYLATVEAVAAIEDSDYTRTARELGIYQGCADDAVPLPGDRR
jgi:hypothetical protein